MCRLHIKTVREIRREESLIPQNSVTTTFDLGQFSQWVSDNLPWPPAPDHTFLPTPTMFFSDVMQPLPGGLLQTAPAVGGTPASAATQLQPQTSAASQQSQNGSQEPSELGTNGLLHQTQEDGGQSQQPQTSMFSHLSQQIQLAFGEHPLPVAGFFQSPEDSSGSSQESQAVSTEPVFPAFPHTGTNELTQAVLHGLLPPGYETMNEFLQLQAGPSGLQQPQGDDPSQQAHSGVGGSSDHLSSTSTSGLSAPQANTGGASQQLGNNTGAMSTTSLLGQLLQEIHYQITNSNYHHTHVHNQEINLQHQPHAHGSVSGFSQQFHPSPNESSLQPHPGPVSSQSHVGLTGFVLPVLTTESIFQQHQVGTNVPSASPEVSNNGPSQQEVPVSGHSHVPSVSTGPFFLPSFIGNGGHPLGNTGMSGSSQQPGNTNALFHHHHSHIIMGGLSQQSQATASETSQQPQGNTNENAQHLQTDTDVLSQTSVGEISEESQSDAKDF